MRVKQLNQELSSFITVKRVVPREYLQAFRPLHLFVRRGGLF